MKKMKYIGPPGARMLRVGDLIPGKVYPLPDAQADELARDRNWQAVPEPAPAKSTVLPPPPPMKSGKRKER